MILEHHKVRACRGSAGTLVEPFRRADWIDVTLGLRTLRRAAERGPGALRHLAERRLPPPTRAADRIAPAHPSLVTVADAEILIDRIVTPRRGVGHSGVAGGGQTAAECPIGSGNDRPRTVSSDGWRAASRSVRSTDVKKTTTWSGVRKVTRREFVGGAIAAGAVFSQAPALLRGQNLNNKLNIAFIACGGRGRASLNELTLDPGRRRPSAADGSGPARQASGREHRRALRHQPGVARLGWRALPEGREIHRPARSSTARTTSTPSWCPPPSTRTRSPPTWR